MSTEIPPDKKHKNFHYLDGVSTELQDSFEKNEIEFSQPVKNEQQTLVWIRAIENSQKGLYTGRKRKKKIKYDLGKN